MDHKILKLFSEKMQPNQSLHIQLENIQENPMLKCTSSFKKPIKILRPFNVFGETQSEKAVMELIKKFITMKL